MLLNQKTVQCFLKEELELIRYKELVQDLFQMAATTPARAIGIDHLTGSVAAGKWANLVILDQDLQLQTVILRGEIIDK